MIGSPNVFHAASAPSGSPSRYRAVARIRDASGIGRIVRQRATCVFGRSAPLGFQCVNASEFAPRRRGRGALSWRRASSSRRADSSSPLPDSRTPSSTIPLHGASAAGRGTDRPCVSGVASSATAGTLRGRRRGDEGPVSRLRPRVGKWLLIEETEGSTSGIVNDHPAVEPADHDDVVETSGTVLNQGNRGTCSSELRLHETTHRRGRTGPASRAVFERLEQILSAYPTRSPGPPVR